MEVENTPGRFISMFADPNIEDPLYFLTAQGTYEYESYDNKVNPGRGMLFRLNRGGTQNLEDTDRIFGFADPLLAFYNGLTRDRKLVLKTQAQGQFRLGNDFEFYQGAQIGSDTGLRGYREERFTGRNAAVGSADLRYSFNTFRTGLSPIQIGVFGGYDVGRVWVSNDSSNVWHSDFGGGFWINAADVLSGTLNVFTGDEGVRITFGLAVSM